LWEATVTAGVPALTAFGVSYALSGVIVSVAIALTKNLSPLQVWRTNNLATLWIDLLSVPLIFVFAWVYAAFGPIAAAALWVPILGLRQVHTINLELERTNEELLELMVKSMEARDLYTSGHSRRVQHYSAIIARAMGLPEREINVVSRAALLHDVGKIHEKYGPILMKGESLTAEEWAVIQEHPIDGAVLVSTMSRLKELASPIRHHHENWDGTGYPDGLAGELIPLHARIIRFADTIDAMTTERPYRRPLGESEVRSEIVRCRGKQFDPEISDRLLSSPLWSQLFKTSDSGAGRPSLQIVGRDKRPEIAQRA
jgi:putative nucleotidyltransferase with HDIG domain